MAVPWVCWNIKLTNSIEVVVIYTQEMFKVVVQYRYALGLRYLGIQCLRDTVWNAGLLGHWKSEMSSPVPIHQGVRQQFCVHYYTRYLWMGSGIDILSINQRGVFIEDVFIGSPVYADGLALTADNAFLFRQ